VYITLLTLGTVVSAALTVVIAVADRRGAAAHRDRLRRFYDGQHR
jgi:hypothetical protein